MLGLIVAALAAAGAAAAAIIAARPAKPALVPIPVRVRRGSRRRPS